MRAKWIGFLWVAGAVSLAVLLAGGLHFFVDLLPPSTEAQIASHLPELPVTLCELSPRSQAALEKMRRRLVPVLPGDEKLDIHLHLIKDETVNAFAFLGGTIYVNSGLLENAVNGDEVAGVLAHEIAHVKNRDVIHAIAGQLVMAFLLAHVGDTATLTRIFARVANLKFTKKQEEAADHGAMERLKASHISTLPLANFFHRLEASGESFALLSDHPDSESRAQLASSTTVENPTPVLSQAEWNVLKATCR